MNIENRQALYRNCVAEASLGLLVLVAVGQLGILPPGGRAIGITP